MFEIACGCGKTVRVTPAQAGSTLPCTCGQDVRVPPLSRLRQAVVERTEPPAGNREQEAWYWGAGLLVGGELLRVAGWIGSAGPYGTLEGMFAYMAIVVGAILVLVGTLLVGVGKGIPLGLCLFAVFCIPLGSLIVLLVPGPRTGRRSRSRPDNEPRLELDDEPDAPASPRG